MTPITRSNIAVNAASEVVWNFAMAFVAPATVMAIVLIHYGASPALIGSIEAVSAGASILPQLLGPLLFRGRRNLKARMIVFHYWAMLPWLVVSAALLAGHRYLPDWGLRWGVLGCFALFQVAIGLVVPAWWAWLGHLFDAKVRGLMMGVSFCASSLAGAVGAQAASRIIGGPPDPARFPLLYLLAGIGAYASMSIFWLMHDPADAAPAEAPPGWAEVARHFAHSLRDRNFRAFLIGRMLGAAGFCIMPLVTLYYTSAPGGAIAGRTIVALSGVQAVLMGVGNLALGLRGGRRGYRTGLVLGAIVQCAVLVLLLTTRGRWSCAAVYAGSGLCFSAGFMCSFNLLLETCPHAHPAVHVTIGNLTQAPVGILAPLLAGWAAQQWGLRPVFAACLGVSSCAVAWYLTQLRDPRIPLPARLCGRPGEGGRREPAG